MSSNQSAAEIRYTRLELSGVDSSQSGTNTDASTSLGDEKMLFQEANSSANLGRKSWWATGREEGEMLRRWVAGRMKA